MLHLPYTLMVLSFVIFGAAVSPVFSWPVLWGALLAYFLGLGIGAHFLDQIPGMGSRYVFHWPPWALWMGGIGGVGAAVGIGISGAFWWFGLPFLGFVAIQGLCAVGYPLARLFGGLLHRDSVFALSWGSLPFLTSFYAQSGHLSLASILLAGIFAAVAVVEIRISRLSRARRAAARLSLRSIAEGGSAHVQSFRIPDLALQSLALATLVLSLGLLLNRLIPGV
jgi:hypothetical protein